MMEGRGFADAYIETIRAFIGTGSSSTIAPYLRTWRTRQGETQQLAINEKLPEEVVALIKGLWERLVSEAEIQINVLKQDAEQARQEFNQQLQASQQANARLEQQSRQISHEKEELANDKLALEQAVVSLQQDNAALQAKRDSLAEQLRIQQERIDELNRLNQQTQANLEHYREAVREQRVQEQQRYEQQQYQLEQTIQQLRQALSTLHQQYAVLEQQYAQACQEKGALQNQQSELNHYHEAIKLQLVQAEKEVLKFSQAQQHWQSQCQMTQEKLDQQYVTLVELQKQIAVLSEQLAAAKKSQENMETQNKLLAHEKWALGEEKAQLMGQIKLLKSA